MEKLFNLFNLMKLTPQIFEIQNFQRQMLSIMLRRTENYFIILLQSLFPIACIPFYYYLSFKE